MEDRFEAIKKAVDERNMFLAEHPDLQTFQDEIEEALKKAGSLHNRNVILSEMMRDYVYKLQLAVGELGCAFSTIHKKKE